MAADFPTFAILDVETTGFSPQRGDRIIEIAVVKISPHGEVLGQFDSLVNPERDLGPTNVHGIKAKDVKAAPLFREIAGDVLNLIDGSTLVAHNAPFDSRFLLAETNRAGLVIGDLPYLCTLAMSRMVDDGAEARKLQSLCAFYGIVLSDSHSALGDALATSQLCIKLLQSIHERNRSKLTIARCDFSQTQIPPCSGKALTRKDAKERPVSNYIAKLIAHLPVKQDTSSEAHSYYAALDTVLEDRLITSKEADSLIQLASELGLDRDRVKKAHRSYTLDLLEVALADGTVTDSEMRDIDEVRQLLCVSQQEFDELQTIATKHNASIAVAKTRTENLAGLRVCFTGALSATIDGESISREQAEELAIKAGMDVTKSVTKSTNILVIADPESQSSKAIKARKYGIRIISEMVFWRLLGINVE